MSGPELAKHHSRLTPELRQLYTDLIEERFGLRLAPRQHRALSGAVNRLSAEIGEQEPLSLWRALRAGRASQSLEAAVAELTTNETYFFRDAAQIDALRRRVIPQIIERHSSDRRISAWSAGCATGEEAYTLAILIREQLLDPGQWAVEVLGLDLDPHALQRARDAVYGDWSFRDVPQEVRRRYFRREGRKWKLIDSLRQMVRFLEMNLVTGAPPGQDRTSPGPDLILCRNVTIYFAPEAGQRLYRRMADALAPGGWLVLGASDPSPGPETGLHRARVSGTLVWRKEATPGVAASPPPAGRPRRGEPHPAHPPMPSLDSGPSLLLTPERDAPLHLLSSEVHLHAGMLQLDLGDPHRALESLRRAAFLDPDNPLAQFGLGRAYIDLREPSKARAALANGRRLLGPASDSDPVVGANGLVVGELRFALDQLLAAAGASTARRAESA